MNPCEHFNMNGFTCDKGNDCECVEGQHDDIVDLYWPPEREEATGYERVIGLAFIIGAILVAGLVVWLIRWAL